VKLTARIETMFETAGGGRNGNGRAAVLSVADGVEGTGARLRRPLAQAATLFAALALLLAAAAPAASAAPSASPGYGLAANFGAGQVCCTAPRNPIAIDSHGNVFLVREGGAGDIGVYAPSETLGGTELTTVTLPEIAPDAIAIDPTSDAIYVQDRVGTSKIIRMVSDGAPVPTYTVDAGFTALAPGEGIAVDPTTHNLLVAYPSVNQIRRFDTNGTLLETIATPSMEPQFIAVAADGSIYAAQQGSPDIAHLSPSGSSLGKLEGVGAVSGLAIDPSDGRIVAAVGNLLKAYSPAGALLSASAVATAEIGIAIDGASGRLYGFTGSSADTYDRATIPGVEAPAVSEITPTDVKVSAEVEPGENPGGGLPENSDLCFEYRPSSAVNWAQGPCQGLSGPETVDAKITGLDPNLVYLVRAKASNSLTFRTSGSAQFQTKLIPPEVHTGLAGGITDTAAQLTGTIATYGSQTTYHFEYGLTINYGSSAPAGAEGVAGNERAMRTFTRMLTGLQPGTEYHYRLVARNSAGEAEGEDLTFITTGADEVAPGRGYELVTPVDKRGASIRPDTFFSSADGSAIVYGLTGGASDSASAPVVPRNLSRRGPTDWSDWQPLDPPLSIWRTYVGYATQAVSEDSNHSFVVSNRILAPGAIDDGANIYLQDLQTGAYTLVGSAKGFDAYISMNGLLPPNNYLAGAPDFSWVIFASKYPLLPGVTGAQIYKWTETGGLELESRLPGPNGGGVPDSELPQLPGKDTLRWPVASDDGNTVYFSFLEGADAGVYRRENGQTTAISVSEIPGDPATPLGGQLDATSRDGRYAFFSSEGLTSDAPAGQADMYRYDSSAPVGSRLTYLGPAVSFDLSRFIGISDDGQTAYWNGGNEGTFVWRNGVSHVVSASHLDVEVMGMQASPSPSGRYLAYLQESGYLTGNGDVRLYDADTNQSVCVSCVSGGSPGAGTPLLNLGDRDFNNSPDRVVFDDGTVFFDTTAPLVSADHNGSRDVYSYRAGKLTLISPGDASFDATFADASADGSNVFFITAEPLVGEDTNGEPDVYDARIGGGFPAQSPPAPPASCLRADCGQAENGPLSSPSVSSSQSHAAAKPKKQCPTGTHARKVKGKARCVKQHKKQPLKHKKNAGRADTNRRQGR
jgi:sugar lactone lactonase YvrE